LECPAQEQEITLNAQNKGKSHSPSAGLVSQCKAPA
jgi:hypothetical protein